MDQTNEVLALKAEIYDLSKNCQQLQALISQVAQLVRAETVDDMLAKINKAFAPSEQPAEQPQAQKRKKEAAKVSE